MASALIVTYERRHHHSVSGKNSGVKKNQKDPKGYALDHTAPGFSYMKEAVAESDERLEKPPVLNKTQSETASEDSCTLKRKSISLNVDGLNGALNSDLNVNSLSRDERRQLRKRLKLELEQVQVLYLKLEARESQLKEAAQSMVVQGGDVLSRKVDNNGSASRRVCEPASSSLETLGLSQRLGLQPSVVVPDFNLGTPGVAGKEKRTPKANLLYVNSEFVSGKDKMPPVEKPKSKPAAGLKRSLQAVGDSRGPKRQKADTANRKKVAELMRQCGTILKKLMSHKHSWVFNEPVDVVKLGLHDYFKIILNPMDLGTVKSKLERGEYTSPSEFAEDVRLTFANAMKYNPQGHDVYIMADLLRKLFEDRWRSVEEKLQDLDLTTDYGYQDDQGFQTPKPPQREIFKARQNVTEDTAPPVAIRRSKPAPHAKHSAQPKSKAETLLKRVMTYDEKRTLSKNLESLSMEKLEQILHIIKSKNPDLLQTDDEIEVDIDSFDTDTLWELHRFVINCNKSKGKTKKAQQKMPPLTEGGASELQQRPNGVVSTPKASRRGGDGGEEEVDIGDNLTSASFPTIVIDKDGGAGSKLSSSSSSSSESGSSSSDSDSGSSSGSDSDADDVLSTGVAPKVSPKKEPVGSGAVRDQRGSPALKIDGAKRSINDIDEENLPTRASMPGSDAGQEGEVVVQERQVSPGKLLRAALLKKRFVDTILKAQEKTLPLNKSDRADPEKLRKEREELERRQKEEKARLQAEAEAAELARQKAEAEAAAEARQRRESEREAARLALQKMEKTVEIDENTEILKDLEMLRSAHTEHIPSSGDETSPVRSADGLSGFDLHGGNPLERLGLFMKLDDDEEEEHEHRAMQKQQDNAQDFAGDEDEEGEIED